MSRYISLALLAIALACYFFIPAIHQEANEAYRIFANGDQKQITNYVQQFGFWGPAIVILVMVVQMFLIVIPSWLLMIIAILAYGKIWGVILSVVAVLIASTVGYFVGNSLSAVTLNRLVGEQNKQQLAHKLDRYGIGAIIVFRLAPFLSNDAISFVAGMLKMSYWRFILATFLGILPLAVLIAFFSNNTESLKAGLAWVGGLSLLAYGAYVWYDHRKNQ